MRALPKSLSVRLLLVFITAALVILFVLSALFSYGMSTEWKQQIRPHLAQYVRYVRDDLGDPPSRQRADEIAATMPVDIHLFAHGELLHSTNKKPFNPARLRFNAPDGRRESSAHTRRSGNTGRRSATPLQFARSRHHAVVKIPMQNHTVYVELDRKFGSRSARGLHLYLLPVVLVALLGVLYGLLRELLSPISDIKTGVATMTAGNLQHRIPVTRQDDLGQLASSVNGLSARIQHLLDAKRELLLSVSHELRSPITRANLATTMMPKSKHRTQVLEELGLLDSLIESLIESEKLQSDHSALNLATVDVKVIVQTCLDDVAAEHKHEAVSLSFHCDESTNTVIQGDEVRLRLMCRNLLNNAVQHGKTPRTGSKPDQLQLQVGLKAIESSVFNSGATNAGTTDSAATHSGIELTLTDQGPGATDSELASLTDAFYRPDRARAHGSGGVGLGLSLAQLIAEAHGGSLTLSHRPDNTPGLVVSVRLARVQHPD